MENYGFKEAVLAQIITTLRHFPQVEEAILYGSRAKGNYRPGSDIDITLKGSDIDLKTLNSISTALDDLLLPYTFDLSAHHHINNPDLLEHIQRVGKRLY